SHSAVLQELPKIEPVMSCWFHSGDYSSFTGFLLDILNPCHECQESGFIVTERQRFIRKFIITPVECPYIMGFTSDINPKDQSFFRNRCNFCVLCVILHFRYLSVL